VLGLGALVVAGFAITLLRKSRPLESPREAPAPAGDAQSR